MHPSLSLPPSLVAFPEEPPLVWHENKLTFHSLYDSKTAGKANGRPRQNSVPAHAAVETKSKGMIPQEGHSINGTPRFMATRGRALAIS